MSQEPWFDDPFELPERKDEQDNQEEVRQKDYYSPPPVDCLPHPLNEIVNAVSKAKQCDVGNVLCQVLPILGAAIGNTIRVELGDSWSVPPIVWTLLVTQPGNLKSPPMRFLLDPLVKIQQEYDKLHEERIAAYKKANAAYRSSLRKWENGKLDEQPIEPNEPIKVELLTRDPTVESLEMICARNPRGPMLACDEGATLFGNLDRNTKGGGDHARISQKYGAEAISSSRKVSESAYAQSGAAWISANIQPGILRGVITSSNGQVVDGGLLSRFIIVNPDRMERQFSKLGGDSGFIEPYGKIIRSLYNEHQPQFDKNGIQTFRSIRVGDSARGKYEEFFNSINKEIGGLSDQEYPLGSALRKIEETPLRLAGIFHAVRLVSGEEFPPDPKDEIDELTMEMAIKLTEWIRAETRRNYRIYMPAKSSTDPIAKRPETPGEALVRWIDEKGGEVDRSLTQTSSPKQFRKLSQEGKDEIILSLVREGRIRTETRDRTTFYVSSFSNLAT
jgi:hypothetical protein